MGTWGCLEVLGECAGELLSCSPRPLAEAATLSLCTLEPGSMTSAALLYGSEWKGAQLRMK